MLILNLVRKLAANKALLPTTYVAGAPSAAAEFRRYMAREPWT